MLKPGLYIWPVEGKSASWSDLEMVDWNPFSEEGWDNFDAFASGKAPAKKKEAAPAPPKASSSPAPEPVAPPLHGFSRGKPAFVDVAQFAKPAAAKPKADDFDMSSLPNPFESPAPAPPPEGMKRILVIDDNMMVRRNHKIFLERLGFEVIEADDGVRGLDKMDRYKAESFSLVIVDLNMPVMSGEEFVAEAKQRFDGKMPPVWVCTVASDAWTVKSLLLKGIAGYLLKPVHFRLFANRLRALFPDMDIKVP